MYVDPRQASLETKKSLENRGIERRRLLPNLPDLDRRTAQSWIALVALALFVALAAACSSTGEDSASSESAIAAQGRWKLPATVLATGAKVRVTYDEAPKWTGTAACSGRLKLGGQKLGEYLIDRFAVVSSVGGYSCRKNTADSSRMSVHGTGRALDVFVPKTGGAADNGQGDKVANWLVVNAQRIGVQLVIWDRTIWRANGKNDGAYSGPHPHDDHLHVELSTAAGLATTPWFKDMTDDADASTADGGDDDDASTTTDGGRADATPDASAPDGATDAGKKDASPVDPADDDHADGDAAAPPGSGTGTGTGTGTGETEPPASDRGDPSDGLESAGDAPGETSSLPDSPKSSRKPAATEDEEPIPTDGCSAAPRSPTRGPDPAGALGGALAIAIGLAAWLRRKRA